MILTNALKATKNLKQVQDMAGLVNEDRILRIIKRVTVVMLNILRTINIISNNITTKTITMKKSANTMTLMNKTIKYYLMKMTPPKRIKMIKFTDIVERRVPPNLIPILLIKITRKIYFHLKW